MRDIRAPQDRGGVAGEDVRRVRLLDAGEARDEIGELGKRRIETCRAQRLVDAFGEWCGQGRVSLDHHRTPDLLFQPSGRPETSRSEDESVGR
jgi:hypothetical protein